MNLSYIKYDGNVDTFCSNGGFEELVSSLDKLSDSPTIRYALDVIGYCKDTIYSQRVQNRIVTDGIAKILHLLATNDSLDIKTSALLALYVHIQKYSENQNIVCQHGGIEILTELLTLDCCGILLQVLKVLHLCLSNNEHNLKTFTQIGGFQMLFDLTKNVEKENTQFGPNYVSIINYIVDVVLVCGGLQGIQILITYLIAFMFNR